MRDMDVAPKCVAFREARRDHALAAADYFKITGRNFEVELELAPHLVQKGMVVGNSL
ncbi:MAG: hypothetical protein LBQ86_01850 [Holophagales bacterium]|jgi:hypothetical protein|nr:hypothetical protein [Holophagales bacterium]